jgi:glycosyltransferase involved in cell wall biosynthesis
MKRALLFAPYFLPRRRVGSMRPFRFVVHLREYGWTPTVVTIQTTHQSLTEREAELLDGIDIIELDVPFDRTTTSESQLGMAKRAQAAQASSLWQRRVKESLVEPLVDTLDRQFPSDTWLLLFAYRYRQLRRIVRRVRPDVLWSTGDPFSSLVITEKLVRDEDLPWVADFRDPWTLCDVRSEGLWPITQAVQRWMERRIVSTADVVLFQAEQTERVYRAHYADLAPPTTTIYNSFDPVVFHDPVYVGQGPPPEGVLTPDHLDLGFFGRFRAMSPATLMVDVLARAKEKVGRRAEKIRMHSFGPLNDEDDAYARAKGVRAQFVRQDAVPLERALSALRRFDVLFLSTDPRRDEIIPAKLLEYLAVGRPVLSLSRNPEVADILGRTGTGIQVDPSRVEVLADLLVDSLRAKRAGEPLPLRYRPVPDVIRRFGARPTTAELATLFNGTAAGRLPTHTREPVAPYRHLDAGLFTEATTPA